MSITDAGRKYLGLKRAASYKATAAGIIPTQLTPVRSL